jgi:hypothetical protein
MKEPMESALCMTEEKGKLTLRSNLKKWAVRVKSGWNGSCSYPVRGL